MNIQINYKPIVFKKPTYAVVKIIPHQSVLNSSARRFQNALYELFSVKGRRIALEGLHIAIKPKPDFWWMTKFYVDDAGAHIEYYCAMPEEFVDSFKTKFRNHEQWRKSTISITSAAGFNFPDEENTDLYSLKYQRHNMFSLKHEYQQQTSPVRDLVGIIDELENGETVDIFIRSEPIPRKKWKKIADYANEQWDKGDMPYRAGFDPLRLFRDFAAGALSIFYGVKSLFDDFLAAVEKSFFHKGGEGRIKKEKPPIINPDRAELLVNGDLSKETKNKRNLPVFNTSIRCAVHSKDAIKRSMLARSVANAFADLNGDNRLEMTKINIRGKAALNELREWKIQEQAPNVMSVDELGKLEQLPTSDVQAEYEDALQANTRVEIELPKVFLHSDGILAGTATDRGTTYDIHVPTDNPNRLYTPRAFNGSPRMGKDQAIINFIVESYQKHGIGAIIPDFIDERGKDDKGHWKGMANAIRDHIDQEDLIDLDFSNTAYSFYLGLQTIFRNVDDPRIAADLVSEYLCDFLLADGDEDKFQTSEFCREAAKATMGDLQDMKRIFKDQKFRKQKITELDELLDMDIWRDYDSLTDKGGLMSGRQGQYAAPVIRRIDQLANREYSKPMFCQSNPNSAGDLYRWVEEGKIVILRIKMPSGAAMPEPVKCIFAYWIVMLTFLIKLSLDGRGAGTFLVLNEPHQYLSKGLVHFLKRILSEAPKYKLAPIFAFHHFAQFREHPGFVDMLLASSINWHIFKNTNSNVYKELMPYLQNTFEDTQTAFESTKAFQYIAVWLDANADYAPPFIVDALPMVGNRYKTVDNTECTELHIQTYGRPTNEVLTEIKAKNRGEKEPPKADPKEESHEVMQTQVTTVTATEDLDEAEIEPAVTVDDEPVEEEKPSRNKKKATIPTIEEIDTMIDAALAARDEEWFKELTKLRKKILRRRKE